MNVLNVPTGQNPPNDINVIIEIPEGSAVKYEIDKETGAIFVDRFLYTMMSYPAAYGYIPNTLADDGDPLDALVLVPSQVVPGAVIRCRPIGMLLMEDEKGMDEKIICVPHDKIHPQYSDVQQVEDLPQITRAAIEHFFKTYKDLDPGKWVRIHGWGNREEAETLIVKTIEAYE
jgi:inorganic pyrophosphatase